MPLSPEQEACLDEFIGRYGLMSERRGGGAMMGRILAFLMVADDPVQSSADIAEALQTSSGTVSINTRMLEQAGLIERVSVTGRRGAFFRVRPGAWRAIFRSMVQDVADMKRILEDALEALPGERGARVREAHDFYAFLDEALPSLIERWNARSRRD